MLRGKEEFDQYFQNQLAKLTSKERMKAIADMCADKFGMSVIRLTQILNFTVRPEEITEAECFWILSCMKKAGYTVKLDEWFTPSEISVFENWKQEKDKDIFPFVRKMIQVSDDTFVGKIGIRELVNLRNAGYIKYNFNTQRRAQKIVRGEKEFNVPFVDKNAVKQIQKCMENGEFISNTITLNIGIDADYSYNPDNLEFIIQNETQFDIIDGYHRMIAGNNLAETDQNFDYPMELRITLFSETKAQTFIWQEDQKTHMPKSIVQSYNANDTANRIAKRVADDPDCNFHGLIKRSGGCIDFAYLSDSIREILLKGKSDKEQRVMLISLPGTMVSALNKISEKNPGVLESGLLKYQLEMLCILIRENAVGKFWDINIKPDRSNNFATFEKAIMAAIK